MINLIPQETKRNVAAGRANIVLRRYALGLLGAFIFATGAYGVGYYATMSTREQISEQKQAADQRIAEYQDVQARAQKFSSNLATAKTILSNEISFSQLAIDVAKALPSGTKIKGFTASMDSIGKPMTLEALAKSEEIALELKTKLENSPVFENVSINSVTSAGNGTPSTDGSDQSGDQSSDTEYPVSISLSATLSSRSNTSGGTQ